MAQDTHPRIRWGAAARRAQIIEAAGKLLTRDGYYRFSLSELAETCGLTRPGVMHHIGSKERLLLDVLLDRDQRGFAAMRAALVDDPTDLRAALDTQVRLNIEQPELVRLYTILAVEAMDASHPAHGYFQHRWQDGVDQMTEILGADRPDSADRAARIYVFLDGLQLNWLRDPAIDLWRHWSAFADIHLPHRERR